MIASAPARPIAGLNHVIAYGQSLSSGWEGWPALSCQPRHDSLMLGGSVRPRQEDGPRWEPVGAAALRPLVATVQDRASGALLSAESAGHLPPGSDALGETVLEGAVNHWRSRWLATAPAAASRRLLASSCGVGGRGLAALSKGAPEGLFNRLRDCVDLAHRTAGAAGLDYAVVALLFLQGEADSRAPSAGDDRARYRRLLRRFREDVMADVVRGVAGQAARPGLFLYQTGGAYAHDAHPIGMAQLDVALEDPGCYMVGPAYPVPDKGGHLAPDGYRWLGAQFGKVLHRVLTLGQAWRPLHPLAARCDGRRLLVDFHVPVPPLAWGRPFHGGQPVDPVDRGFTVVDAGGVVPIADVALTGPAQVALTLARRPGPGLAVRYADRSRHRGLGALHDSDPALADDRFAAPPPAGAPAPWMGERYPLVNWCVGFSRAVAGPD